MATRSSALIALLAALVVWMALDAGGRTATGRSQHLRRAVTAAEAQLQAVLATPDQDWTWLDERPARHPFASPGSYDDALRTAREVLAWDATEGATGEVQVVTHDGRSWLVQRSPGRVRARPWEPVARSIAASSGAFLDLSGDGTPVLPGVVATEAGLVTARVPGSWSPLAPWLDLGRALLAIVVAGLLVSDLRRAEVAGEREQARAEARDVVLQRISHELRTPAASVRSLSDALSSGAVDEPEAQRQFLALIGEEADRLAVGIDRLLRAARGEGAVAVRPVPMDLAEWAVGVKERWAPSLPGLRVEAPAGLPWRADPDRLDEAVDALLDNARKYGGSRVVLRVARRGDAVAVAVCDDGPGIPAPHRGRLVERLERLERRDADPGGYGLGLWATAEVARAHGGALSVEDGACFVLTLGEAP